MYRTFLKTAAAFCICLLAAGPSSAAPTDKEKKLLDDVAAKLLAVCEKPKGLEWPPNVALIDDPTLNAYATLTDKDGKVPRVGEKLYPIVRVHTAFMTKVIEPDKPGAEDRLALIVGHEIGHIIKGHCHKQLTQKATTNFLRNTFGRDEEVEADYFGLQLMLKAGYDMDKGLKGITRFQEVLRELGQDYSSFEGLDKTHPSWDARLEKADKDKAELWKAMSAFNNGVVFLTTEDYTTAIACFEKVTRQFPGAYEPWANLGYARLMRYCDQWDKSDIQSQGIGQIVVGGFYTRLDSVKVRGKDKKLWFDAVGALRESNRLKPGQTIVLMNLGLAYLLSPDGKDVGEATRFFSEATTAAKTDKNLDPVAHASLLINLGVATLSDGKTDKAMTLLDDGEKIVRSFAGPAAKQLAPTFDAALLYTRALVLGGKKDADDKEKAINMLGQYLRVTSPLSLWWDQGYDRYAELCKAVGREPKDKAAFKKDRPEPTRLVTGLKLKKLTITLGDDVEDVTDKLGKGEASRAVQGMSISRIRFENEGIELLATDQVLAILLVNENAPAIELAGKSTGTGKVGLLKVGMSIKEVEELLGEDYQPCELTKAEVYYRYYREQGVAFRVSKGKVVEIVIVKIPTR
jgi:tetratricopeptide (TPR) repeat protein